MFHALRWIVFSLLSSLLLTTDVFSAQTDYRENVGWYAYRDLTSSNFSQRFSELSNDGFRMTDVDAYQTDEGMRYSMMWEKNDGRGWAEHRNMSSDSYYAKWKQYRDKGYRPTDVEGYMNGSSLQFAGIWIENQENISWYSYRNMTDESYGVKFSELSKSGYYLVDMEAYNTPYGLRYAAIWYRNDNNIAWAQYRNMSRERYQEEVDLRSSLGYVMVDYETYQYNGREVYAAIWHKDDSPGRYIRTNRSELQYANYFRQYRDDGYRPVDFEREGDRYGGIWAKVRPLIAHYSHKPALDSLLSNYRSNNDLPGISAAIYHNGALVWSQGFGVTSDSGKIAHGKSVYPLASISKVIGGTIVGRLEDQGQRFNGVPVSIAGGDTTRSHVPAMPVEHSHTLQQLMSHTACIPHYNTDPGIPNQTTHYATQMAAAASVWNEDLLSGCSMGSLSSYSTHAFTLLGAAMEAATDRTVPQLVKEELADEFGLPSMRVLYTTPSLPDNYERSEWFSGGNPVSRSNNSWKAFGGGIESNPVDLAKFGWNVADARLTSASFRDNNLLTRQPQSVYGYAWFVSSQNSRRRASHSGSWTGSRGQLSIWPDDSLSIALLSNQNDHDGLSTLADDMADLILP